VRTVRPCVIAIDGPAASGKSTTAVAVARELGAAHLDSGALYRALAVVALELERLDSGALLRAAELRGLALRGVDSGIVPFLDGQDAEPLLRSPEVNGLVSEVSALPEVREWVNARLREAVKAVGRSRGQLVIVDGRDIGTAVFPDAPVKVFLTASPEARARRRLLQRGVLPGPAEVDREAAELAERDRRDRARAVAPLRQAADAMLLDTTNLGFADQVQEIVALVRRRLPQV
jgi:cytidylate kinase